jgi:hypothetical protein
MDDKLEEIVTKMKAHDVKHQQEVDFQSIELLALARTQTTSKKRSSNPSRMSRKSRDCGSESDGSRSESEKLRRRHTQECYRCHRMGHIAKYCSSTAPVESAAPTETAAATTTSIENYWMTVPGRFPQKKG